MVIGKCPRCDARYTRMRMTTDFVHDCNIPEAIDAAKQEDVVNIHTNFTNPDGTSGSQPAGGIMLKGTENKLFGTDGWLEGEDVETVNRRGRSVKIYRSRSHFEYIEDGEPRQ